MQTLHYPKMTFLTNEALTVAHIFFSTIVFMSLITYAFGNDKGLWDCKCAWFDPSYDKIRK